MHSKVCATPGACTLPVNMSLVIWISESLRQWHEQSETKLVSKKSLKKNLEKGKSLGKRLSGTALLLPQGGWVKWDLVSLLHLQFLHMNEKTGERKLLRMWDAETELFLNRMLLKPSRRHVLVL